MPCRVSSPTLLRKPQRYGTMLKLIPPVNDQFVEWAETVSQSPPVHPVGSPSETNSAPSKWLLAAGLLLLSLGSVSRGMTPAETVRELVPLRPAGVRDLQGERYGTYSERTIVVALTVDREQARLISFTLKDRPFVRSLAADRPGIMGQGSAAQLEFALVGAPGLRYTQLLDFSGICLEHGPDDPPHIQGDTIRVHRDSVVVEFPEVKGLDRIEVAREEGEPGHRSRRLLGSLPLESSRFNRSGGNAAYGDLAFAAGQPEAAGPPQPETAGSVIWPEQLGDPDITTIFGNAAESDRRINITIVPDGYTYAQKSLMLTHATQMVQHFRATTPYREHDNLINYILVYAYSVESGTDQCDCSIVANTAMSTGFPNAGYPCGDQGNRCLYYGYSCDTNTSAHIATAELRAPFSDAKVVMVNTARYGGCGGQRAVFSAANASATDVAAHELGHSLASLADEYATSNGCGSEVGGINTSTNAISGAWPEWIADLGPPWEGAQYWTQCIYRPAFDCTMRSLGSQYCSVCNQRWALSIFGHGRVAPTAPVQAAAPASPLVAPIGTQQNFSVTTRFAVGPGVTNTITWKLQGPGFPTPTVVATGVTSHSRSFSTIGTYTLTCEVVADTNFVKPSKYGGNMDVATWSVEAVEDADSDGYYNNVDCNDHNAAIHPGVTEICNGVDDECDNLVDEGFDQDTDGFTSCGGDCDDSRATVRPGGSQICDGLNNNCLAPGWPSLAGTTEFDDDSDTYSECQGDCDDSRAAVRPGGTQTCDGLNNNCLAPGWPSLAGTNEFDDDADSYTECLGDCDDAVFATHPGAVEINDGKDNQCPGGAGYALVDELGETAGFPNPNDPTQICWPVQSGAGLYETVRSGGALFSSTCTNTLVASNCMQDSGTPAPGQAYYYLIRPAGPHVGSWGARSSGIERTGLCGGEALCGDAIDNDTDGRTDCEDPDCLSQASCQAALFSFVDSSGDDIASASLLDFFTAHPAAPADYLFFSLEGPAAGSFSGCLQRADFYRNSYVAFALTGGSASSGAWSKWYRTGSAVWNGPSTAAYENSFGPACVEDYSWCLEPMLGDRNLVVLPLRDDLCEAADMSEGCGDGTWRFTLRLAPSRLAACGF